MKNINYKIYSFNKELHDIQYNNMHWRSLLIHIRDPNNIIIYFEDNIINDIINNINISLIPLFNFRESYRMYIIFKSAFESVYPIIK